MIKNVGEYLEETARSPQKIAILEQNSRITFSALEKFAKAVCHNYYKNRTIRPVSYYFLTKIN